MEEKQNAALQPPANYRVQSVNRAIDILDCFSSQSRDLTLQEITERTGLNRTTARRLVANLKSRDFLQLDPTSKRYRPGLRLFELGGIVFSSFSIRKAAAYPMSHLEDEIGATTLLATRMEDYLVYIDKREGRGMIAMPSDIGWRRPLNFGLLGRILMAYLHESEAKRILKKYPLKSYTPYSIKDEKTFLRELEKIRKQGYGIDIEEVVEGIMGVAAPIRDYSREIIAALCVGLPASSRRDKKHINNVVESVKRTCDEISTNLGYMKI
jgi:IclR family transcriptional regulator, KDG regulon repressor